MATVTDGALAVWEGTDAQTITEQTGTGAFRIRAGVPVVMTRDVMLEDFGGRDDETYVKYTASANTSAPSSTQLKRTGANWTVNAYARDIANNVAWRIKFTNGACKGESREIISNTADTLVLDGALADTPDSTSIFWIVFDCSYALEDAVTYLNANTANARSGVITLGTGKGYVICRPIDLPASFGSFVGSNTGGGRYNVVSPPRIYWGGEGGGTVLGNGSTYMFKILSGGGFYQWTGWRSVVIMGGIETAYTESTDSYVDIILDITDRADFGSAPFRVSMLRARKHCVVFRRGAINAVWRECRFDVTGDAAILYVVYDGGDLTLDGCTWDNESKTDALGNAGFSPGGGLLRYDASAPHVGGAFCSFGAISCTFEVNNDLGTERGIIMPDPTQDFATLKEYHTQYAISFHDTVVKHQVGEVTNYPAIYCAEPDRTMVVSITGTRRGMYFVGVPGWDRAEIGQGIPNEHAINALTTVYPVHRNSYGVSGQISNYKSPAFVVIGESYFDGPIINKGHLSSLITKVDGDPTDPTNWPIWHFVDPGEVFGNRNEFNAGGTKTIVTAREQTVAGALYGGVMGDPALLSGVTATTETGEVYVTVTDASPFREGQAVYINGDGVKRRIAYVYYNDKVLRLHSAFGFGDASGLSIEWVPPEWDTSVWLESEPPTSNLDETAPPITEPTQRVYSVNSSYPGTKSTTFAPTADALYVAPFFLSEDATADELSLNVRVGGGGGTHARLGIYETDNHRRPTDLVLDGGEIDISSTGVKTLTISQALPRGWYGLALIHNGLGFQVDAFVATQSVYGYTDASLTAVNVCTKGVTYGALADWGSSGFSYGATAPAVCVRFA